MAPEKEEGKFNLGLGNLEAMNDLTKRIEKIDIFIDAEKQEDYTREKAQHAKYKLCKRILNRAIQLFDKEDTRKKFRDQLEEIQIGWKPSGAGKHILQDTSDAVPSGFKEAYYPQIEKKLDDFLLDLFCALQDDKGVFMPPKEDLSGL
jgi:hypothetical protein|tara:strand:- start:135 stop:578 length:444 start_codon:yes stop_codon:yes gene_type:complete